MKTIRTLLVCALLALASLVLVSPVNASDLDNLPVPVLESVTSTVLDSALFPEVIVVNAVASHPLPLRSSYRVTDTGYHFAYFDRHSGFDSHRITDRITPVYRPHLSNRLVNSAGSTYGFLVQRE